MMMTMMATTMMMMMMTAVVVLSSPVLVRYARTVPLASHAVWAYVPAALAAVEEAEGEVHLQVCSSAETGILETY